MLTAPEASVEVSVEHFGVGERTREREIEIAVRRRLELEFDSRAACRRHVEDDARRA
jgi:hypothetical protein